MSLCDLRGELELRHLSTQTPGLKGEARRHALLQRLQSASAEILPPQARKLSSVPDMEPLQSSRSSTSSYSAASEFLFYDPESTRDGDPVGWVPTLRFPGSSMAHTAAADRELSGKSSPVSTTPSREQLESELVELRTQLHESRAHRSQTTGRHLQEAGFDQDLDKLSSAMARLESERQRLLRVVFAHEVVQTTALSGRQSELIQEDAVQLIEQQQQSVREQIHYIKRAIALSQDNQESHQEDSAMEQAIGRIELQLQQYAPTTSSRSVSSSVSVASFGSSPAHSIPPHLPVLTRCRSVPSQLFHETWSELDEEQKLQLHEELRANKSFRIRRGRVCIGNAQATARLEKASETGSQSNFLAFTRYPPTPADKLGIKALFLEQSQRSVGEIRRVYELALAAEPDHALVLGNYARFLHEKCRDLARADQCFAKALRIDPSCVSNVAAYASFLHHTRRDYDQAESLYAGALQLAPNDPQLLGNYASLVRKQANGSVAQLRQARDLLTRAVENDSQSITNRLRLCAALEDLGDATSALVHYEQLVREVESSLLVLMQDLEIQTLTPRSSASISQCAHVFGNFANFLLRSRHVDRAKTMYTKALSLQPDDTLLQRNLYVPSKSTSCSGFC
jgi:tetratricopeptide (TPR) repeat protein